VPSEASGCPALRLRRLNEGGHDTWCRSVGIRTLLRSSPQREPKAPEQRRASRSRRDRQGRPPVARFNGSLGTLGAGKCPYHDFHGPNSGLRRPARRRAPSLFSVPGTTAFSAERCPSWPKERDWKSRRRLNTASRVRIPPSPPCFTERGDRGVRTGADDDENPASRRGLGRIRVRGAADEQEEKRERGKGMIPNAGARGFRTRLRSSPQREPKASEQRRASRSRRPGQGRSGIGSGSR
jgi:hypothetical protein